MKPYNYRRRKPMAEINVVPYIDVTLVLLIIFMITAPLLTTGVEVDLPRTAAKPVSTENNPPLVITINKEGLYYVDIGDGQDEPVSAEDLTARIKAVLILKPGTAVMIRGDKAVNYGKVVAVMAALKNADIPSVGLLTKPLES